MNLDLEENIQAILQRITWPIAIGLLIAVLVLWALGVYLQLPLAVGFLAGTLIALVNRYRDLPHQSIDYSWGFSTATSIKLGYVIYFWLFIAAVASLRTTLYTKPVIYYVLVASAASLLVVLPKTGRLWIPWVSCVAGLGLVIFLSNQLVYPFGFGGADSYYHISQMVQPILDQGAIPSATNYTSYPVHHIFVVTASLLLDIPGRSMYYYALGFVMMVTGLWVFAFVRTYLRERTLVDSPMWWSSLALVVFISSSFVNRYTNNGNHLAYTGLFIVMILTLSYLIVWEQKTEKSARRRLTAISLLTFATMCFTHHYSVAILLFLLCPLLLFAPHASKGRVLFVALCAIVLTQWTFNAVTYGLELVIMNILPLFLGLELATPTSASAEQPLWLIAYTTAGVSILFAVAQIGILDRLEASTPLRYKVFPALCYAFLSLMAVGVIMGIQGMSPNRMLFFTLITFVPLFFVLGLHSLKFQRPQIVTAGLIFVVAFFALSGITPSIQTSPVSDDISHNKKFETYEEDEIVQWYGQYQPETQSVYTSRSFVEYSSGTVMFRPHLEQSQIGAKPVPLTDTGRHYSQEEMRGGNLLYSSYDEEIGYRPGLEESRRFGEGTYARHAPESFNNLKLNNRVYDSGTTQSYGIT